MSPKCWFLGPIGMGINIKVEQYPEEDNGTFCKELHFSLVWDCCIIAYYFGKKSGSKLFGNKLGNTVTGIKLREVLSRSVNLVEIGSDHTSMPIDFIVSSERGSRTWFSNITPPRVSDAVNVLKLHQADSPQIIYSDFWEDETGANSFDIATYFNSDVNYLNYGDCVSLNKVFSQIPINRQKQNTIIQVSLKDETEFADFKVLPPNIWLIITRGSKDVILCHEDRRYRLPVSKLENIDTTGAGAIFSAMVIKQLLAPRSYEKNFPRIIQKAIRDTHSFLIKPDRFYYMKLII